MSVTIAPTSAGEELRPFDRSRLRRQRVAARIIRSWRSLTGGGARTLVACSGGADSTALLLALASCKSDLVVGHIVHDLRPRMAALADRDRVRDTAAMLGLPFFEAEVRVERGNAEGNARRRRYAALARLAREANAGFVASAHHADDQLETIVMAVLRGAGPAGMRGCAPARGIGAGVVLVRPMLGVSRAEAEALCAEAGVGYAVDESNGDISRFRAALRHGPIRAMLALRPGGAARAARTAELMRDVCSLIEERVGRVFGESATWDRETLRRESALVVGAGLRRCAEQMLEGRCRDRLTSRLVDRSVAAVRDGRGGARTYDWPGGLRLVVDGAVIRLERADSG